MKSSAKYYQLAICSKCKTREKLMIHKYSDDIMCEYCVGELLEKERDLEEEELREIYGEEE
jgi:DNA-directed RNA polymerase subunit RPC12/RpoP